MGVMGVSLLMVFAWLVPHPPPPPADQQILGTLVRWQGWDPFLDYKMFNSLIHRDGVMIWRSRYESGREDFDSVVVERPSPLPGARRFDTQPDAPRSEYLTVDAAGVVKFFTMEGHELAVHEATFIHPNAMAIGLMAAEPPSGAN